MYLLGDLVSTDLLPRLAVAALLWVLLQHLIRFHRRGIEIVGAIVCFLGFTWWIMNPAMMPPLGALLFVIGFVIHALGRLLHRFRTR